MKDKDTISIITICFNNKEELLNTMRSIDTQTVLPYEHIIVDGSNNDEIKNYLQATPQPTYRLWISEPDEGISDAFNKGIKMATGSIVNMLNSGDTLYDDNVLKTVYDIFANQPSITWMHGKYSFKRGGQWIIIGKPFEKSKLYRGMRRVCHQAMYVKKTLHDQYGLYDKNQKVAMDYDFLCRIANEPMYYTQEVLATFLPDGVSDKQYVSSLKIQKEVYERYFPKQIKTSLWIARQRLLHAILHSSLGNFLFSIKKALKLENW